jgi:Asp/Glu/hydantoin racemase
MLSLIAHAVHGGADAVLLACSLYGPVLEVARREHRLPMLSSDEELFAEVARGRYERVLLLGYLAPAVEDSVNRLTRLLAVTEGTERTQVIGHTSARAAEAVARDDLDALEKSLTEAAIPYLDADAVVLGTFALSPAHTGVQSALGLPVLSAPLLAACALRERVAANATRVHPGDTPEPVSTEVS